MKNLTVEKKEKRKMKVLSTVLFGVPMGLLVAIFTAFQSGGILFGVAFGAGTGLFAGLLFTFAISIFSTVQAQKFLSARIEITEKHAVMYDGEANNIIDKKAVGGWLFLTSDGLLFKPHKFNIQVF